MPAASPRQPLTARCLIRFRGVDGQLILADPDNQLPPVPDDVARLLVNAGYAVPAPEPAEESDGTR